MEDVVKGEESILEVFEVKEISDYGTSVLLSA